LTKDDDEEPAWSPDGSWIAFRSSRDGPPQIFVMRPDGTHATRITHTNFYEVAPAWSPDGRRIAFQSTRSGFLQVFVMNADGSAQVPLTENPSGDGVPDWRAALAS
jgi:TolB protein